MEVSEIFAGSDERETLDAVLHQVRQGEVDVARGREALVVYLATGDVDYVRERLRRDYALPADQIEEFLNIQ